MQVPSTHRKLVPTIAVETVYCFVNLRGSQIKGCVYKFNREDKVSFNVFVLAETVKPYTLEEGQYDVSIYDWPLEEDWKANPPALNKIITVTKPRSKHSLC